MILSMAFRRLGSPSKDLILMFLLKRDFKEIRDHKGKKKGEYVCTNNDNLTMSYKELTAKGWHNQTITRALDQLFRHGFIEHVHRGGAFDKDISIYKLSDKWKKWKPGMSFDERQKGTRKGRFNGFGNSESTLQNVTHPHTTTCGVCE